MHKIAIDELPLSTGHAARGTGVYTRNLITGLEREFNKSKEFSLDKLIFKDSLEKLPNFDLIHYPYFDLFYRSLPIKKQTKTIVTVHDVTPLLYPRQYPPGIKGKLNYYSQKMALNNVDAVITVSETSKKDIVRFLNIPKEKVFPTYEAPSFKVKKSSSKELLETKQKFNLPEEFVLYVGDVNYNKNLINLVKAVKKAGTKLVIVGKQAVSTDYDKNHVENAPLRALQETYGNDKDILRLGYLEEKDLNSVWQLATVYSLPSFYEGFGLSLVEAMGAGVPLVCSRTQAIVEVAGEACLYFDPNDVSDMTDKLTQLLKNTQLKEDLVKLGKSRVSDFSWEKTAKQTIEIYKKVLQL